MSTVTSDTRWGVIAFATLLTTGCSHSSMHQAMHHSAQQSEPQSEHQPPQAQSTPQTAAPAHNTRQPSTYSVQDDASAWKRAPQMQAFYDTTVTTFAHGNNIDVDAYEAKSFAIFREFARANHVSEEAMLDHLKLIPRQVVGIVKENPAVLKSYDNFWTALVGPE